MPDESVQRDGSRAFRAAAVMLVAAAVAAVLIALGYFLVSGTGREPNVLLITVDTLRADRLGCYGCADIKTPNMDRLAAEGVRFPLAVCSAPLTTPSHATILTGVYPTRHRIRDNFGFRLDEGCTTIAEILRGKGYATAAVVSGATLSSTFGLNRGFDFYDETFTRLAVEAGYLGDMKAVPSNNEKTGGEATASALAWLDAHRHEKFFLWLHYFDPHAAYVPPEPFRTIYKDNPYNGEIAYVDDCIGKLLARMREWGIEDDTVICLTADHGEALGEHGEKTHGLFIYDSTILVPLVFRAPWVLPKGGTCEIQARTVDIVPTILDILHISTPGSIHGRSLLPIMTSGGASEWPPAYCENFADYINFGWSRLRCLRTPSCKYIACTRPELYDLESDPSEVHNLALEDAALAARMRNQLAGLLRELSAEAAAAVPSKMSPELKRKLQSLGYLGGRHVSGKEDDLEGDAERPDPKDMVGVADEILRNIALARSGQCRKALQGLLEIAGRDAGNIYVRKWIASLSMQAGDYARAIESYRRIVEAEPRDVVSRVELGKALMEKGDIAAALAELQEAIRVSPDSACAHAALAGVLYRTARFDEAKREYEKALRLEPDMTDAVLGLAYLYAHTGAAEKGIGLIEKAKARRPGDTDLMVGLAEILADLGRTDEAIQELENAIRFAPGKPNAYLRLAGVFLDTGRHKEALPLLRRALEIVPESSEVHDKLGKYYFCRGDAQNACAEYLTAIRLNPNRSRYYSDLAAALCLLRKYDAAVESCLRAIRIDKHNADAHQNLGAAYFALKRYPEAETHLKIAAEMKPKDPRPRLDLARIQIKQRLWKQAILTLSQVLKDFPDNGEAAALLRLVEKMRKAPKARPK